MYLLARHKSRRGPSGSMNGLILVLLFMNIGRFGSGGNGGGKCSGGDGTGGIGGGVEHTILLEGT